MDDGKVAIMEDGLEVTCPSGSFFLDFAVLMDFRLKNYRIYLDTSSGQVEFSMLGRQTENFFEQLWEAYNDKCAKALFINGDVLYEGEGDFVYTEQGVDQKGIAKIRLYDSCLALFPHDRYARRIPLCFSDKPVVDDFQLSLMLDTGDTYHIGRIGRYGKEVFDRITQLRSKAVGEWQTAHRELENELSKRLGYADFAHHVMATCGGRMITGLFSAKMESFWFAALHAHKAAVELVTDEKTATYLYQFPADERQFEYALHHAMESVALHREVIFADLADKPLYQMSVERNYHVDFLRKYNVGRIIHTGNWERQIRDFLQP